MLRLFIALPVPEEVKRQIGLLQDAGREKDGGEHVSWPKSDNIHITLIFLGETDPRRRPDLEKAIEEAAGEVPPFSLTVSGLSVIPDFNRPRVIAARIQYNDSLFLLHRRLASLLEALGMRLERRPYRPHITLGRIRKGRLSDAMAGWMKEKGEILVGEYRAESVYLMESQLKSEGSVYTTLFSSQLMNG